jgi:hypothetical protein
MIGAPMNTSSQKAMCVVCLGCGAWTVMPENTAIRSVPGEEGRIILVTCANPNCDQPKFHVMDEDMQEFTLTAAVIERKYFYPSEVRSLTGSF